MFVGGYIPSKRGDLPQISITVKDRLQLIVPIYVSRLIHYRSKFSAKNCKHFLAKKSNFQRWPTSCRKFHADSESHLHLIVVLNTNGDMGEKLEKIAEIRGKLFKKITEIPETWKSVPWGNKSQGIRNMLFWILKFSAYFDRFIGFSSTRRKNMDTCDQAILS